MKRILEVGRVTLSRCSQELTAEGFVFQDGLSLEEQQQAVLEVALERGVVTPLAVSLYRRGRPGSRRVIIVDPAWPDEPDPPRAS